MAAVVLDMSMSLDGFVTGPDPRAEAHLGDGGQRLHEWMFSGNAGPGGQDTAPDASAAIAQELFATTGAVLMGRRMFELGIGPWGDTPFPVPCFVLTHHARDDLVMTSGTFSFITGGLTAALDRAKAAANSRNVLAHSPGIAQQLLRAGLLDEIQIHLVPILLGAGRRLFENTGQASRELQQTKVTETPSATHLRYRLARQPASGPSIP
jgi:dihydrofolate reductase